MTFSVPVGLNLMLNLPSDCQPYCSWDHGARGGGPPPAIPFPTPQTAPRVEFAEAAPQWANNVPLGPFGLGN